MGAAPMRSSKILLFLTAAAPWKARKVGLTVTLLDKTSSTFLPNSAQGLHLDAGAPAGRQSRAKRSGASSTDPW
eukprot:7325500-Pyramimonas_sp.AAC.1